MNDDIYGNRLPCEKCGGVCCKRMPCHLSPDDIKGGVSYETLSALLDTGDYAINWWESYQPDGLEYDVDKACEDPNYDPPPYYHGYYIRARVDGADIVDPSWGGRCVLLTDSGCSLTFEDRPKGGRMVIASEKGIGYCISEYTKEKSVDDWWKYHNLLETLSEEYEYGSEKERRAIKNSVKSKRDRRKRERMAIIT